jgi:hypothetical protein
MLPVSTASVAALNDDLRDLLEEIAEDNGLRLRGKSPSMAFRFLIKGMKSLYGRKPAILIDEYDAPILAKIAQPKLAEDIRVAMGEFYSALKAAEDWRGFTFITGVARFPKTSIFSKLNNLVDLTFNDNYASICGLTIEELDLFLEDQKAALQPSGDPDNPGTLENIIALGQLPKGAAIEDLKAEILAWYDGYSWDGKTRLLNPWSVFSLFTMKRLDNYWLKTGTPTFLPSLIGHDVGIHEVFKADSYLTDDLNAIDIGDMGPTSLLFQTGYLTVERAQWDAERQVLRYRLRFPNREVRKSIVPMALGLKKDDKRIRDLSSKSEAMLASLARADAAGFQMAFASVLASIPYGLHRPCESYYQSILLTLLGDKGLLYHEAESPSGDGRLDASLQIPGGACFVIEMKYVPGQESDAAEDGGEAAKLSQGRLEERMAKAAAKALEQIESRKYHHKFQGSGRDIYKAALVVGHYSDVLAVFEKADNWRLAIGDDGLLAVVRS